MLDRTHRFHGLGSLRFVYNRGQTQRGLAMSLKFVRNNRRSTWRVAVVVSRKVHKSAVVRNRIRRRVYEIVRAHAADIAGPYDLVFTVYSDQLSTLSPTDLQDIVVGQMRDAGVLGDDAKHAIVKPKE